jgi:hypothetical protein
MEVYTMYSESAHQRHSVPVGLSPLSAALQRLASACLLVLIIYNLVPHAWSQTQPSAQTGQSPSPAEQMRVREFKRQVLEALWPENPRYSTAVYRHRDPQQYLLEREAALNPSGPIPHVGLVQAAKAALEAGEYAKATAYATKALQGADRTAAEYKSSGYETPRRFAGIPAVDCYANFVLGRLALLDGDIRSAERYLIASGNADGTGDAGLSSDGPNLSLALELLRHGDSRSRNIVLQFLDKISTYWKVKPDPFEAWRAQILAGNLPNFLEVGANLFNN